MCAVSMIMDARYDDWYRRQQEQMQRAQQEQQTQRGYGTNPFQPLVSQAEVDEFRRLLERAREWDKKNSQPGCEMEEKREKLRALAKDLNIEISFV